MRAYGVRMNYIEQANKELRKAAKYEGTQTWTAPLSLSRGLAEYHVNTAQTLALLAIATDMP